MTNHLYTTQFQAGLGLLDETRKLLELWHPGMSSKELYQLALTSGSFPNISSRRLHNIVSESFKSRFLVSDGDPAALLKNISCEFNIREYKQILFLYTCRANSILYDFVREVYWAAYTSGHNTLENDQASQFVIRANQNAKTNKPWSEGTILRVSRYLTGCCADFGLLENAEKSSRTILPYRIEDRVAPLLAYDLHFAGHGDNSVLSHPDWTLFGMDREDILNEFRRLSLKGSWIIQSVGDATRIGWQYKTMEELLDALTQG
jgi:hypothetical protein